MRATVLLALLSPLVAAPGCGLLDEDEERADAEPGCGEDTEPWYVECPDVLEVGPAEIVAFDVRDIEDPTDVWVWLGDDDGPMLRVIAVVPEPPLDPEEEPEESWFRVAAVVPAVEEGVHEFAFGTEEVRQSNRVRLRVVHPERRLTQAEAADLLRDGISALATDTVLILDDPDPEWQAAIGVIPDEDRNRIREWLGSVVDLAAIAREDYLALSAEDEEIVNAVLESTGTFRSLEGSRDGNVNWAPRVEAHFNEELLFPPVYRGLYQLDVFSATLEMMNLTFDVVSVLCVATGVGAPAGAALQGVKIGSAVVKAIIDTFIPTDLVDFETHGQSLLFQGESARWVHWGTLRPQNGAFGAVRGFGDVLSSFMGAVLPGSGQYYDRAYAFFEDIVLGMIGRWITAPAWLAEDASMEPFTGGIVTVIDLRIFDLSLQSVMAGVPVGVGIMGPVLHVLAALLQRDSIDVDRFSGDPAEWANAAEPELGSYNSMHVTGIPFPDSEEPASVSLRIISRGARYGSQDLFVTSVPTVEVTSVFFPTVVKSRPSPSDPNEGITNEDYIYTHTNPLGGAWDNETIFPDTPDTREYRMRVEWAGGFVGFPLVHVETNGEETGVIVPAPGAPVDLIMNLVPGRNEVRLVLDESIETRECVIAPHPGGYGCLIVTFRGATNADVTAPVFLGSSADRSRTFVVWTPPRYARAE